MQPESRRAPYITVSSLAKSLAYPDACGYAGWFPAHFKFARPPFDNVQWLLDHQALVDEQAAQLRATGYVVTCETDNDFLVRGPTSGIIVAGKPDVIGRNARSGVAVIRECKTGSPRPEHIAQTRLYLLFAFYGKLVLTGMTAEASVVYRDGAQVAVPAPDTEFRNVVRATIAALGGTAATATRPTVANCSYCPVPGCHDRVDPAALAVVTHDLFD